MDDKNTSTSQQQQQSGTSTTTPNTPSWLSSIYSDTGTKLQQVLDSPTNLAAYDPEAASSLQTTAAGNAASLPSVGSSGLSSALASALGLTSSATPTYSASTISAPTMNASQINTSDIQRLLSPYTNDVVNSATGLYDKQAGQDQATLAAQAGLNSGAFGSSGYALGQSNLLGSQALDRSNIQSTLLNQGYDTALQGAEQDSAQQQAAAAANQQAALSAAQGNQTATNAASAANQSAQLTTTQQQLAAALGAGGLASTQNQNAVADTNAQAALGQTQYSQDTARQQYYLSLIQSILGGTTPLASPLSGSTTNASGTSSGTSKSSSSDNNILGLLGLNTGSGGTLAGDALSYLGF